MKRLVPLFVIAVVGLASLSCMAVNRVLFGEPPTATPVPSTLTPVPTLTFVPTSTRVPPTLTPTSTPDSCPNGDCITGCVDQMHSLPQNGVSQESKTPHRSFEMDNEYTLVTYTISGDQIKDPVDESGLSKTLKEYQNDRQAQKIIWNYFAAIIPPEQRNFLTNYIIFTDGKENLLAAVAQSDQSPSEWTLSVDIMDATNPQDLTFTLIHEYGHLLTLNPVQVIPSQAIFDNPDSDTVYEKEFDACQTYFTGEGCSKPASYVNKFFDKFWPGIYDEWSKVDSIEDEDAYYNALDRFYRKHKDQFVSDYAPTSPAEDIAESFSFFILEPKPTGHSIADQKVLFFYDYPELMRLRSQMGHRLCDQIKK